MNDWIAMKRKKKKLKINNFILQCVPGKLRWFVNGNDDTETKKITSSQAIKEKRNGNNNNQIGWAEYVIVFIFIYYGCK